MLPRETRQRKSENKKIKRQRNESFGAVKCHARACTRAQTITKLCVWPIRKLAIAKPASTNDKYTHRTGPRLATTDPSARNTSRGGGPTSILRQVLALACPMRGGRRCHHSPRSKETNCQVSTPWRVSGEQSRTNLSKRICAEQIGKDNCRVNAEA